MKSRRPIIGCTGVVAAIGILAVLVGCSSTHMSTNDVAKDQVFATERAFAETMARGDLKAFSSYVSEEAVFFGGTAPLRGKQQVVESWSRYFEGSDAPFSWEPDQVDVLSSGTLALSTGPVRDPSGKVVARFNSIWRQEKPNVWRIVFDKGSPVCADPGPSGEVE